uniref:DUF4158 domain-containing protein n=1 Tax=Panagrellus redivivus TaxID=6233 RepID=A0A7E4UVW1_PANRE
MLFDAHLVAKFEKFDFNDLLTLLKTQKRGFYIFIRIKYDPGELAAYFAELKRFLDKNLAKKRKKGRTAITISNGDAHDGINKETWHVPLFLPKP